MQDRSDPLRVLLDSEKARDALFNEQPNAELVKFLGRVGAYVVAREDQQDPQNMYGGGGGRLTREAVPLDAQMPFEEYRHLMEMGSGGRILVANHPSTPEAALLDLAADADRHVADKVCRREGISAEVMRVLAAHPDVIVVREAATLPRLDRGSVNRLSSHPDAWVRLRIAQRSDIELALFLTLATELMKTEGPARHLERDTRLTPELRARLPPPRTTGRRKK